MLTPRFATRLDLPRLAGLDPHFAQIPKQRLASKIEQREQLVVEAGDDLVGLLRFSYFWSTRPFIDWVFVAESHRARGLGQTMLSFLEAYLQTQGHGTLYSSAEEPALASRAWHVAMGFAECGVVSAINFPDQTKEVFFYKEIATRAA